MQNRVSFRVFIKKLHCIIRPRFEKAVMIFAGYDSLVRKKETKITAIKKF